MTNKTEFEVHDVFVLYNGKTIFAGRLTSGVKVLGTYRVHVGDKGVGAVNIIGEMHFPAKGTSDIALYTDDSLPDGSVDLRRGVALVLAN